MIFMYIPIILIGLYKCNIIKNKDDTMNILNSYNTNNIKGLIAFTIIFHHLSQRIEGNSLFLLRNIGYLIVGLFLFYSGYGLAKSTLTKSNYLDTFWTKRLPKLLIPFILSNLLFIIGYVIFENKSYTLFEIIKYIMGINLIDSFKWYIWVTIMLYIGYYFTFKFLKRRNAIIAMFVYINVYFWLCYIFKVGGWWYNSVFSFFVGILFGNFGDKIVRIVKNNYIYTLIPITVFLAIYIYGIKNGNIFTATIANVSFVISFVFISIKIRLGNKITTFLGSISYEIYLIHRLVLDILGYRIENKYIFIIASVIGSIILAYLFSIILKKIMETKIYKLQKYIGGKNDIICKV